jgi:uncharacterized protein (DUF433 family)
VIERYDVNGPEQISWAVCKKRTRPMTTDRIEINPHVMMGKPVIKGTRITVELILRKLADGATEDELIDAYPRLTRADIRAAIRYAADTIAHEEIILLSSAEPAAKV